MLFSIHSFHFLDLTFLTTVGHVSNNNIYWCNELNFRTYDMLLSISAWRSAWLIEDLAFVVVVFVPVFMREKVTSIKAFPGIQE